MKENLGSAVTPPQKEIRACKSECTDKGKWEGLGIVESAGAC